MDVKAIVAPCGRQIFAFSKSTAFIGSCGLSSDDVLCNSCCSEEAPPTIVFTDITLLYGLRFIEHVYFTCTFSG